jgi:hypothetical protein
MNEAQEGHVEKYPESGTMNACSNPFFRLYLQTSRPTLRADQLKEATNQSLNQKSRCFYIGALFF